MTDHRLVARTIARSAATLAAALLAGCGGGSTASPPPTTAPDREPAIEVDWASRTVTGHDDPDVDIHFCEGEAPFVCFTGDGEHLGVVELTSWPVSEHDVVDDVVAGGGDDADALEALAADFVASFTADRAEGCGEGYEVVGDEPVPAVVAGEQGLRYGFRGVVDGDTVEQVIVHAAIDDGTLWLLTAAGYDDGGCLAREGEFDVDGLQSSSALIGEVAAGSRPPAEGRR